MPKMRPKDEIQQYKRHSYKEKKEMRLLRAFIQGD